METMTGNPVSSGIAHGPLFVYRPFHADVAAARFDARDKAEVLAKYEAARQSADRELQAICASLRPVDPEKADIFQAHRDILFDEAMDEDIRALIEEESYTPDYAVETVFSQYASMLAGASDALLSERSADILDVKQRLLRNYYGLPEKALSHLARPVIVAAHDLLPSDTAMLDRGNVLGIAAESGGKTSHTAIIARSYGIPAVLGIRGLLGRAEDGMDAVLDAMSGELILSPDRETVSAREQKRVQYLADRSDAEQYRLREALTADGVHIDIGLNIGSSQPEELRNADCTDCVGLYRTEFLYMQSQHAPSEDEQFEAYKKVLLAWSGRHITLRTMDIGGDKSLPYLPLPHEDNPFLGNRALRLSFSQPELFRTQIRAALRASVFGDLWLMLPMVSSLDNIRRAKGLIRAVRDELLAEGVPVSDSFRLGIMIEVPSIAVVADQAAREVDFASIGTNDLCQYLTAADRMNPALNAYYQTFHPAMFRVICQAVQAFVRAGKPISVCGEMGGNELAAPVLVGAGMRTLSMNISQVPRVKRALSRLTLAQMETLARQVQTFSTEQEVLTYLRTSLSEHQGKDR